MSEKKPTPIIVQPNGKKCPICGKSSYSQGGIHPQCAVIQADAPRGMRLAAQKKAVAKNKAETSKPKSWAKTCPKCKSRLPASRGICECGHNFFSK